MFLKIGKVHNMEHIPVGIEIMDTGKISVKALNDWWLGRSIPASRSELDEALRIMNIYSTKMLLEKSFGLSLSDQYWINKHENPLDWDKINFFENKFSEDVGNALFGQAPEGEMDLISPDNTYDGWLKKKWIIANEKRVLLKGGSLPYHQEPVNEVFASTIMQKLGIPCVSYSLTIIDGKPMSLCEDFITTDTELVSAWNIMLSQKKRFNHVGYYEYFLNCCDSLGIPGAKESINKMLAVDFLIANTDRHFNNFGAVRNANTLEWLGIAPIFDTGTSLWHNQDIQYIKLLEAKSKPFKAEHDEQIKLVDSFEWLNLHGLENIGDEFNEIYSKGEYINKNRRDNLLFLFKKRVEMLKKIQKEKT
jgi:hypothetical protein